MTLNTELINNIFFYGGIISTVVLLVKALLPIDFGSEIGGDFNIMTESDSSFTLLTIESILSFFMCFGWMGYYALHFMHSSLKVALIIALVSGVAGMAFFAWLFSLFKKMESVPKVDLKDLIEKQGKSYTRFAPKGNGQIQIDFMGKLATLDAVNNSDVEINSFEMIKVVKVENNIVYIERI